MTKLKALSPLRTDPEELTSDSKKSPKLALLVIGSSGSLVLLGNHDPPLVTVGALSRADYNCRSFR